MIFFFQVTEHLIDQLHVRVKAAAEVSRLRLSVMEELDDAVSHFASHVRDCINHLGADGFEARFKHPDTNLPALDLINDLLTEYNLRLRGMNVDTDGNFVGKDVCAVRPLPKSLLRIAGGESASSRSAGTGEEKTGVTVGDVEMSAASGPGL